MNKPNWTPGPWEVFEHKDHSGLEIGPPCTDAALKGCVKDTCVIHLERLLYGSDWYKEKKSNAHLIAAAPELYEALTDLLHGIRAGYGAMQGKPVIEKSEAALAKARWEVKECGSK